MLILSRTESFSRQAKVVSGVLIFIDKGSSELFSQVALKFCALLTSWEETEKTILRPSISTPATQNIKTTTILILTAEILLFDFHLFHICEPWGNELAGAHAFIDFHVNHRSTTFLSLSEKLGKLETTLIDIELCNESCAMDVN